MLVQVEAKLSASPWASRGIRANRSSQITVLSSSSNCTLYGDLAGRVIHDWQFSPNLESYSIAG